MRISSFLEIFLLLAFGTQIPICSAFSSFPTSFIQSKPGQIFTSSLKAYEGDSSISEGDRILVIGATGGVGQLVTGKLMAASKYKVRVTSRNPESAKDIINDDNVEFFPLDLVQGEDENDLKAALTDVDALVIATGTTAFPTAKWKNGNNPKAVDLEAVKKIADACEDSNVKRVILVTSVGVERQDQMPFLILNLFGVLDAKKGGEDAIKNSSVGGNYDYAILRPGRLIGGPFTNEDVAKLLKVEGGAENGLTIEKGDTLLGDCKRDACAEAVVQSLTNEACKNKVFCLASNEEPSLSNEDWENLFVEL